MTSIEWCDATWNPVRGCSVVSPGCTHCYAMKQAHRFSGRGKPYEGLTQLTKGGPVWTGNVRLVPELLDAPLRWRKPRRVFVNSMSDLFHEGVPLDFLYAVWGVMAATPRHTYQVLTKRPERMREVVRELDAEAIRGATLRIARRMIAGGFSLPLPNVWLGVSVEDQARADERVRELRETPAAVRFLSVEPLLGPVTLRLGSPDPYMRGIDWIIVGGESGPGARPCRVEWIRDVVRQCREASVPVFVKQLGAYYYGRPRTKDQDGDSKGGDINRWPADLRVREWPAARPEGG